MREQHETWSKLNIAIAVISIVASLTWSGCHKNETNSTKSIDLGIDMVEIPGQSFRIGRTEVTQKLWVAIMGSNPSKHQGEDLPVENVSWQECHEFLAKLNSYTGRNFRLPTEDEWLAACRAGNSSGDGNGQDLELDTIGWYDGNSGNESHPVAQKTPNAYGVYDMIGNVWEWTSTSVDKCRVFKGGGFRNGKIPCSVAGRNWGIESCRFDDLGLRLAMSNKM